MPATEAPGPPLTLRECADELRVPLSVIRRNIRAGTLVALSLSPHADPRRRGPKCYRVERAEWERFKAACRTRAEAPGMEPAGPARRPKRGRPREGEDREGFGLLGDWKGKSWS